MLVTARNNFFIFLDAFHRWFNSFGNSNVWFMLRDLGSIVIIINPCFLSGFFPSTEVTAFISAIDFTSSCHLAWSVAFSRLRPIFLIFLPTCLLYVLFGSSLFLWPSTSDSNDSLKSCPYHRIALAFAFSSTVAFNPIMPINSSVFFLSISFTPLR